MKSVEDPDGDHGSSMYSEVYSGQVLDNEDKTTTDGVESINQLADNADDNWLSGKLKFRKHIDDAYRSSSGSDGRNAVDYEVIDPRSKISRSSHEKSSNPRR